jgi:hypothetical protein
MASKIPGGGGEVKLNYKGMGELLKSPAIISMLRERMAAVQSAVPGSTMETRTRRSRAAVVVKKGSDYDEANTAELSRALDLAGGLRGTQVVTKKTKRSA